MTSRSISRLQLAAALLEYDNDNDNEPEDRSASSPERQSKQKSRVNHRDSALFKALQPPERPPSLAFPTAINGGRIGTEYDPRVSQHVRPQPFHEDGQDEEALPARYRDSQVGTSIAGPSSPSQQRHTELDVSRWDLPAHLVATSPPRSRPLPQAPQFETSIHSPLTALGSPRPDLSLLTRSVNQARPETLMLPPVQRRITSVHLEQIDSLGKSDYAAGEQERLADYRQREGARGEDARGAAPRPKSIMDRPRGSIEVEPVRPTLEPRQRTVSWADKSSVDVGHPTSPRWGAASGSRASLHSPSSIPLPASPAAEAARPMSLVGQNFRQLDLNRTSVYGDEDDRENLAEDSTPNPFALPALSAALASRFDPKNSQASGRPLSSMSLDMPDEAPRRRHDSSSSMEVTSALRRPLSQMNLSMHQRQLSHPSVTEYEEYDQVVGDSHQTAAAAVSAGDSAEPQEIPTAEQYGKPLLPPKYGPLKMRDRKSLLRPKVLFMPAPLAGAEPAPLQAPVRDGWTLGEKPLPAGARSSILTMNHDEIGGSYPPSQAAFGGRPGLPFSQSQRTFRSSLMVSDAEAREEGWLGGTEMEGEVAIGDEALAVQEKRPGKLYGTSLMDQLEARKSAMRNKQRVFTGDSRPSMMSRSGGRPVSYMDLAGAAGDPAAEGDMSGPPDAGAEARDPRRRHSHAPLLSLGTEPDLLPPGDSDRPGGRMTKSRSVFGVDQIWERELEKLKVIQEKEAVAREEAAARDRAKEEKAAQKYKGKGKVEGKKDKGKAKEQTPGRPSLQQARSASSFELVSGHASPGFEQVSPVRPVSDLPPMLHFSPEKPGPVLSQQQGAGSEGMPRRAAATNVNLDDWVDSLDDEFGPSSRARASASDRPAAGRSGMPAVVEDSDSEEDVPLSRLAPTAAGRQSAQRAPSAMESDSEDEVPLSRLAAKSPITATSSNGQRPSVGDGGPTGSLGLANAPAPASTPASGDDDGDDDIPLAVRRARTEAMAALEGKTRVEDIEDDLPLGYKHAEAAQRRATGTPLGHTGGAPDFWAGEMARQSMAMYAGSAMPGMSGMGMMPPPHPGYHSYPSMPNLHVPYPAHSGGHLPPNPHASMMYGAPGNPYAMGSMPSMVSLGGFPGFAPPPPPVSMMGMPGMPGLGGHPSQEGNIDRWRREVPTGGASVKTGGPGSSG